MTCPRPPQSSLSALPSPPALREAIGYYRGLPSQPVLVARSSTTPYVPNGGWAPLPYKELRPVGRHPVQGIWESSLAPKLHSLLDSVKVKWTSTDVVRIGYCGYPFAPCVLWIGVMPLTLSSHDGISVVLKCQQLLHEYDVVDVDVEIRESVVTRSVGPKLLSKSYSNDHIADVCEPLTTTLGLPICAESTPWREGTGGFFITERGNPNRLLLVTARHVVFPPDENKKTNHNMHYAHKNNSQDKHNVLLLGDAEFKKYLKSLRRRINFKGDDVKYYKSKLDAVKDKDDPEANKTREDVQTSFDKTKQAKKKLESHYKDVRAHWSNPKDRILGSVVLSPPININANNEGYTEDWAVIEIDASKIDASNFPGNAIDLGGPENWSRLKLKPGLPFKLLYGWLLDIQGTLSDDQLRFPMEADKNDDLCHVVMKRGFATDLTIGRANSIFSFTRIYDGIDAKTAKEWAILPREVEVNRPSGAFSDSGDSGSVIVDSFGRIGGLLTSGARGYGADSDITYATPITFLLRRMQDHGLSQPCVNPDLAP